MDRVEVVCVTMGQKDLTIADKMHITGDAVFGNQADGYRKETQLNAGRTLRMITTDTRGVGFNRNIALLHAAGDILLFADDDICYADGYADGVRRAYAQHPDADMILFSLDITQGGRVIRQVKNRDGRLRFHRALRYGTCVCSIRRDSQRRANIWFSTIFGGGTNYAHGEDATVYKGNIIKNLIMDCQSYTKYRPNETTGGIFCIMAEKGRNFHGGLTEKLSPFFHAKNRR